MITYIKQVSSLQAYKELDNEPNVVYNIYWSLVGTDGEYTSTCPAMTYVPFTAGASFVPFEEITEEMVIGWIDTYTPLVLIKQYEQSVSNGIESQKTLETPPLPWNPQPVPVTNPAA
jgi:hypothetical protein